MSSGVNVTFNARDNVSKQLDALTRSVGELNRAYEQLEATSGSAAKTASSRLNSLSRNAGALGASFSKVGKTLTNAITKPALVAGAAVAGIVLKSGFSRFTKIDEARAKLKGLGHDGNEVNAIMDNALKSVIGTQYNLDEAATTAASAVAAGIKPGKDLTKYLSSVTDASAIAGVSMAEMGSIFNRVSANGKASAQEINQLADRGIPIWQYLSKETGKSVSEVREELRAGRIDIKTFRAAIENNIGGAAKRMGTISWAGAISNVKAAIGRIGGNLWGATDDATSVSHVLLQVFGEVLGPLEKIEEKSAELGTKIGSVLKGVYDYMKHGQLGDDLRILSPDALKTLDALKPHMDRIRNFGKWFMELSGTGKKAFAGIALGAGPAFSIIGKGFKIWDKNQDKIKGTFNKLGGFKGVLSKLFSPLGIGIVLFAGMFKNSEAFRTAIGNVVSAIGNLLVPVFEVLKQVAPPILKVIGKAFGLIGDAISPIINLIAKVINWVAEHLAPVIKKHAPQIQSAFEKIAAVIDKIRRFIQKVKDAWEKWKPKDKNLSYNLSPKGLGGGGKDGKKEGHNATGTKSWKGGTTLVGERGPELVDLPKGASIHTARDTAQMLGGNSPIINLTVNANVSNEGKTPKDFVADLTSVLEEAMTSCAKGPTGAIA